MKYSLFTLLVLTTLVSCSQPDNILKSYVLYSHETNDTTYQLWFDADGKIVKEYIKDGPKWTSNTLPLRVLPHSQIDNIKVVYDQQYSQNTPYHEPPFTIVYDRSAHNMSIQTSKGPLAYPGGDDWELRDSFCYGRDCEESRNADLNEVNPVAMNNLKDLYELHNITLKQGEDSLSFNRTAKDPYSSTVINQDFYVLINLNKKELSIKYADRVYKLTQVKSKVDVPYNRFPGVGLFEDPFYNEPFYYNIGGETFQLKEMVQVRNTFQRDSSVINIEYHPNGILASYTVKYHQQGKLLSEIVTTLDKEGLILNRSSSEYSQGQVIFTGITDFSYDAAGRLTEVKNVNTRINPANGEQRSDTRGFRYSYNEQGWLTSSDRFHNDEERKDFEVYYLFE